MVTAASTNTNAVAGASSQALADLSNNLDNFLTILTTQLQFQDPLSPLDTHEFTNQLVMFSSVEQQVQQNKNLESLVTLQQNSVALGSVEYIGQIIEANGNQTQLENSIAKTTYFLPKNALSTRLNVSNSSGDVVFTRDIPTSAGIHTFQWDGHNNQGIQQPDGAYTFTITAKDTSDKLIPHDQTVFGTVTGVQFENGNAILLMGQIPVPLSDINGVEKELSGL
ncbi:MAG: Basal-body rod modification protein FlgD [Alphaproteobacteria bacterium MarineAlpha4_Bin2]|nr:MAG: Basal-body rod modification protein FlgD [Alphaproteobacteria bacterium MarineAlpha4_Bin2]